MRDVQSGYNSAPPVFDAELTPNVPTVLTHTTPPTFTRQQRNIQSEGCTGTCRCASLTSAVSANVDCCGSAFPRGPLHIRRYRGPDTRAGIDSQDICPVKEPTRLRWVCLCESPPTKPPQGQGTSPPSPQPSGPVLSLLGLPEMRSARPATFA